MYKIGAMILLSILVSGCGVFGRGPDSPKYFYGGKNLYASVNALPLSAEHRTVLIKFDAEGKAGRFCAEPPPDVAESITSSLKIGAQMMGETPVSAELLASYNAQVVMLAERTVLLDIYRTATYSLCQYYLNGAIEPDQLIDSFNNLTTSVVQALESKSPTK